MGQSEVKPTQVLMEIEVPDSLRQFIAEWSEESGVKEREIVQSLLSHGIASICAVNDWKEALVDRAAPVLNDLVACAEKDTHVLEIELATEAVSYHRSVRR